MRSLSRRPRNSGFGLVELVAGLTLLAVVAGLAAYGGSAVVERSRQRTAVLTLTAVQAEGERISARRDLQPGDEQLRQFPLANMQVTSSMQVAGVQFTEGTSVDGDTVSVHVFDVTTAVYAVRAGGRCLVLAHRLDGPARWGRTSTECDASLFGLTDSWSVDPYAATQLDGDA